MNSDKYVGQYRGTVIDNYDPEVKGRVKIFVPGVYPDDYAEIAKALPWAEPAMPVFGGSFKANEGSDKPETGTCSPPHVGAELWLFFEQGDQNYPIYCFAVQSGEGWMSEHRNQHVIQTDNVRIRVDENPSLPKDGGPERSTSKFDSYNKNCTTISKTKVKNDIPTTLDIDVVGNVNIRINGSVNMQVNGNMYQEINGEKHETIIGNHYIRHVGDLHIQREGDIVHEQTGTHQYNVHAGDYNETFNGNKYITQDGSKNEYVSKNYSEHIGDSKLMVTTKYSETIADYKNVSVLGVNEKTVHGTDIELVNGFKSVSVQTGSMTIAGNGELNTVIASNENKSIGGSKNEQVGGSATRQAGSSITEQAGSSHTTTAGSSINEKSPAIRMN